MSTLLERLPEVGELQTFVAAVDERSIRRAATRLHLSPAGVAKRLDHLEAIVGRTLLVRGPRGLGLTTEGHEFYERAARMLEAARALVTGAASGASRLDGVHRLLGRQSLRSTHAILDDTERLLAHLFDALSDGVVIVGLDDHVVLEVNDAFCALVGRDRHDVVGTPMPELPTGDPGSGEVALGERTFAYDARRLELAGHRVALVRLSRPARAKTIRTDRRAV